jgi:hypothetical protein
MPGDASAFNELARDPYGLCTPRRPTAYPEGLRSTSATLWQRIVSLLRWHVLAGALASCVVGIGGDALNASALAAEPAALIDSESVSQVTSTSARIAGELNPLGTPTEYRFEYGPTSTYGAAAPVPDANAGSGTADVAVAVLVDGLSPGTTYHYRLVVHNSLGDVPGPDRTFSTEAPEATALPDGRAWEMVSPADKHGAAIGVSTQEGGTVQTATDGSAITFFAQAPVTAEPGGNRAVTFSQVLATRSSGGWTSQEITTPNETVVGFSAGSLSEYKLFSPDLSKALVEPEGATPLSPQATERTPYRREADGEYLPLVTPANVAAGTHFGGEEEHAEQFSNGVVAVTATPNFANIILTSPQPLLGGPGNDGTQEQSVFEWHEGELLSVSVLPNGHTAAEEETSANVGAGGTNVRNAVSNDGNRVVFQTTFNGSTRHLYLRDVAQKETLALDVPEAGVISEGGIPVFQEATSDGSRIFFTDNQRLTADSTATEAARDLYLCEVVSAPEGMRCNLKDLTVDHSPGGTAEVLGTVLGIDETGRYVYFVANGALTGGATPGSCPKETGLGEVLELAVTCNLYVRDTTRNETRLVAVLSARDIHDWEAQGGEGGGTNLSNVVARTSENGRFLAFMSARRLPTANFPEGYDNTDARSGQPDQETFMFDLSDGKLVCASCASSGARPIGVFDPDNARGILVDRLQNWRGQWLAGSLPPWTPVDQGKHSLYHPRDLSNAGRLFFDAATPLVPQDANGKEDVYEYEPAGVGSCNRDAGCVSLISSGNSSEESAFLDASTEGEDVFFLTSAKLAPSQDVDSAFDVYDAHICSTALPCPPAALSLAPPCTTADSCRAAPSPQPQIFGPPSSATFSGPGNPSHPASPAVVKAKAKRSTRAQKLAKALKACKKKPRGKRRSCEALARKRYGVKARRHTKVKSGRRYR